MKLSDYVVRFIADVGVKHVFMLPGGGAMHLNDSLGRCGLLEYVCNLHEQASAIAAENYAKITGNLGVALVTTGPGGTNTVTGVAGAWLDSTPCLFVSGQVKRADLKRNSGVRNLGVQEVDIVSIVGPITKYAILIDDPATIRYHLEKAVHLAKTGRPGPVWIDIPLDVQACEIDPAQLRGFDPINSQDFKRHPDGGDAGHSQTSDLRTSAAAALDMLARSQRPVLLAGNGIRLSGAIEEFFELASLLGAPILTTWLAIDLVADDHPLFVGRPGAVAPRGANFTIQNADWLLAIGARLDLVLTAYTPNKLARGAKKIVVDIDLAELNKFSPPPELPVLADAKPFLHEMIRQARAASVPWRREAWVERCQEWKRRYPLVLPEHRSSQGPVSVYYLSEVLSDLLGGDDLIVSGSSGAGIEVFLLAFRLKRGQRILHTTALGAMGFGLPAAIGGCLAAGRPRTVCVDGDGGFQMNIQELATVQRLGLPIKFFILSNRGFASIRASQQNWFAGRLVAADETSGLTFPDASAVARAYGIATYRIENQSDLVGQIRHVLEIPGPVVCDVVTLPDENRIPRVSSVQRADGSMASRPLEDMYPFLDRDEFRANMIVPPLED